MADTLVFIFPLLLLVAAASDVARYEIPNWVSVVLVLGYLFAGGLGGVPLAHLGTNLLTGVAVFAVGAVLFYFRVFGGGDVKLLAASAVWVGWTYLFSYLVVVALVGGIVTLLLLTFRWLNKFVRKVNDPLTADRGGTWLGRLLSPERGVPYGVAIATAGLLLFAQIRDQLITAGGL